MPGPTTIAVEGFDQRLDAGIILEGIPLSAIADAIHEQPGGDPVLGYDDIIQTFCLSKDAYTLAHHWTLMQRLQSESSACFTLLDSLPANVAGKPLLTSSDLSPRTACLLGGLGMPTVGIDFSLALGDMSSANTLIAQADDPILWARYLLSGTPIEQDGYQITDVMGAFYLMASMMADTYAPRVKKIKERFQTKGCADIERDRECIVKGNAMPPDEAAKYLETPPCNHFKEDLLCYHQAMIDDLTHAGPLEVLFSCLLCAS